MYICILYIYIGVLWVYTYVFIGFIRGSVEYIVRFRSFRRLMLFGIKFGW